MRSPALRHVIRLRLTLVGPLPEIWRDVVIDRDLSLADLRTVIQTVFEGQTCRHHAFTDNLSSHTWSRTRRRWGDRWTMIGLHDPTVIDEATARIGAVLRDARPLFYGHTCEDGWLVEIEAHEDDVVAASTPPARVTGGERRAPLPCCRSAYEHAVLVGVLDDPDHPEREALRSRIEKAVGPWARFDPEAFDVADAQRRLDAQSLGSSATRADSRSVGSLPSIATRLPHPARAGFERHIAASGLDLPAVVTTDEARQVTRGFAWVIARAASDGIPLVEGKADPAVVQAGAADLGYDEDRMLRLIAFAKRGRLVYTRNGRLRASKQAIAVAEHPDALWSKLARDLVRTVSPHLSGDLFLLAIADGSLADPAIGARRSAEALALLNGGHRYEEWGYHPERGYYRPRADDCDQVCDCPREGSETWHDVVARAIRDAAAAGAGEGAVLVAGEIVGHAARELGFDPDWLEEPARFPYAVATRTGVATPVDEGILLRELRDLIDLLSMFGLERSDDGSWIIPPILREFARECLRGGSRDYSRF